MPLQWHKYPSRFLCGLKCFANINFVKIRLMKNSQIFIFSQLQFVQHSKAIFYIFRSSRCTMFVTLFQLLKWIKIKHKKFLFFTTLYCCFVRSSSLNFFHADTMQEILNVVVVVRKAKLNIFEIVILNRK